MTTDRRGSRGSNKKLSMVLIAVALAAGLLLWSGKAAAWVGMTPFLFILLLCPLLHLVMHRGHGSHAAAERDPRGDGAEPHRH